MSVCGKVKGGDDNTVNIVLGVEEVSCSKHKKKRFSCHRCSHSVILVGQDDFDNKSQDSNVNVVV